MEPFELGFQLEDAPTLEDWRASAYIFENYRFKSLEETSRQGREEGLLAADGKPG